jgi:hypothetical protein
VGASTPACGTGRTPFAGNLIPLNHQGLSRVGLTVLQDLDAIARDPAKNLAVAAYIAGKTTNNSSQNLPFSKDFISYDIKAPDATALNCAVVGQANDVASILFDVPYHLHALGPPAEPGVPGDSCGRWDAISWD